MSGISVSIHHMLLFIRNLISKATYKCCFNTSHVTLYPGQNAPDIPYMKFQYITCYSLSTWGIPATVQHNVSIHHMLLFIQAESNFLLFGHGVSIHHMLLFIEIRSSASANLFLRFNTSHVTLYLASPFRHLLFRCCFNTSHVTLYPSFYRDFIHPHV